MPSTATVAQRPRARCAARLPPARSICDSSQPPKMSPFGLASAGIAMTRISGAVAGGAPPGAADEPRLMTLPPKLSTPPQSRSTRGGLSAYNTAQQALPAVAVAEVPMSPLPLTRRPWSRPTVAALLAAACALALPALPAAAQTAASSPYSYQTPPSYAPPYSAPPANPYPYYSYYGQYDPYYYCYYYPDYCAYYSYYYDYPPYYYP